MMTSSWVEHCLSGILFQLDVYTLAYVFIQMKTAKLFKNGQSQAVRLPKEFRFEGSSVFLQRLGNSVVLVPGHDPWRSMFEATRLFSDDFMTECDQGAQPAREGFD